MSARGALRGGADRRELAAIFAGGAIGGVARAELALLLGVAPGSWPWPTFIVNIAGATVLGFVATRLQVSPPASAYRHPLLTTGFCGTLTTFATMQVELVQMLAGGHVVLAGAYLITTVAGGLLAVAAMSRLVRRRSVAG